MKVDGNNRLVIDGYHYENLDGVLTFVLGTVTGAAVGNSATDGVQGSLNANSAVENNYISFPNKNDAMQ